MTRKKWSAGDLVGWGGVGGGRCTVITVLPDSFWSQLQSGGNLHASLFQSLKILFFHEICLPQLLSEKMVQSDIFFSSWHILPKGTCLPSEYVNPVLLTQPSTPSLLSWSWTPRLLLSSDLRKWMCAPKYEYGSVYTQSSGLRENAVTQGRIAHRTFPA